MRTNTTYINFFFSQLIFSLSQDQGDSDEEGSETDEDENENEDENNEDSEEESEDEEEEDKEGKEVNKEEPVSKFILSNECIYISRSLLQRAAIKVCV